MSVRGSLALLLVGCAVLLLAGCAGGGEDEVEATELQVPAGVRAFIAESPTPALSAACEKFGQARKSRFPRAWCVVEFEDGLRAFLERRNGWVEHPVGERAPAPTARLATPPPPPAFRERERLTDCGRLSVPVDRLPSVRLFDRSLDCFTRALERGEGAEIQARRRTEEGPVTDYLRTLEGGGIEIYSDATRGGAGPRAWYFRDCEKVDRGLGPRGCAVSSLLPY